MTLPALRNVDVSSIEHEGQNLICLRDAEGYVEAQVVLSPPAFFIAACLDGAHGIDDVQRDFEEQFNGVRVREEDITGVVEYLDEAGFLQTARFEAVRQQVAQAFAASPTRPAHLAGKSYPADPADLRAFIEALFTVDGGPGEVPVVAGEGERPLSCLIVPHIDFSRGAAAYAHGYACLAQQGRPDTVFVFGVAHTGQTAPFVLTRKSFETPFGTLDTDTAIVDELASHCSWDPFEHEIVHRTEHSIGFQAVMLAYLYGTDVRIVPILCGHLETEPGRGPDSVDGVSEFLDACRAAAASEDRRVTVIAGADLAHVGQRFGDPFEIDDAIIENVARRDREDLAHVTGADPDAFYASVMEDGNARQVCGVACIYAALKTVNGAARGGEILHYGYAPDPMGGIVSFTGIAFLPKS
ncbi:MAG: AmmeMemoRadiSam system protein B [Nitrospiraceae bacterium]|nr:AmmeMemoRadiSam system protein B [Nitrospiraceae bacterium]